MSNGVHLIATAILEPRSTNSVLARMPVPMFKTRGTKLMIDTTALSKTEASKKLLKRAYKLAEDVDNNLLELSIVLWELQENNIYDVKEFHEQSGLGRRKTYYLIDIGKAFYNLPVDHDRLKAIGWTKLKSIAPHVTAENYKEKLQLAEQYKASDLDKVLRGEEITKEEKVLLFRFSPQEKKRLEKLLLKYGASKTNNGLINKEQALMKIVEHLGY